MIRNVDDAIKSVQYCNFERGDIIFRGQINADWDIRPSVFREYPTYQEADLFEGAIIFSAELHSCLAFKYNQDPLNLLMTCQHYGIPTRLVDWTRDILIALFFACYDKNSEYIDKNGRLTLAEKSFFSIFPINNVESGAFQEIHPDQMLSKFKNRVTVKDINIIEPMIKNPRMRVQDGCLMLFPFIKYPEDTELMGLNKYIREHRKNTDLLNKSNTENSEKAEYIFIAQKEVDKACKESILCELDSKYGISYGSLFIESSYSNEVDNVYSGILDQARQTVKERRITQSI